MFIIIKFRVDNEKIKSTQEPIIQDLYRHKEF